MTIDAGDFPLTVAIGDADNDGDNDIVAVGDGLSLLRWNTENAGRWGYGGLWITASSTQAQISHCQFKFGPLLDESDVATISDCLFDRSGGDFSFSSTGGGTIPLLRCRVTGNAPGIGVIAVGDGIRAGSRGLRTALPRTTRGAGLQGGAMTGCHAYGNGGGRHVGHLCDELCGRE